MGSGPGKLKDKHVKEYAKDTHLHYDEIVALHSLFCNLLADPKATAVDLRQFESALERGAAGGGGGRGGLPSSLFVHRVLSLFDTEGAGAITFSQFVRGVSVLSASAPHEDRVAFAFRLHDVDGDGVISRADMTAMLSATVRENRLALSEENMASLVAKTFDAVDLDRDGVISKSEFERMTTENPNALKPLSLNIRKVMEEFGDKGAGAAVSEGKGDDAASRSPRK